MNWYGSVAPAIGLPISRLITEPTAMPRVPSSALNPETREAVAAIASPNAAAFESQSRCSTSSQVCSTSVTTTPAATP